MQRGIFTILRNLPDRKGTVFLLVALFLSAEQIYGHGEHKGQPVGFVDALVTHHAVLEDELKLNYYNAANDDENLEAHSGSLEVAVALSDLVGLEMFLPFSSVDIDGNNSSGLGDIEIFIPKISFIREYGLVMTSFVALRIPTGDENKDLGEPGWGFAPHILMDYGKGNFGLQVNAAAEFETEGEKALEGILSLAYSFSLNNANSSKTIISPLLEFAIESPLNGPERKSVVTMAPGVKLAPSDWHIGVGIEFPITDQREFDYRAIAQVGYHVSWENLVK
jgi:hypothetical protein